MPAVTMSTIRKAYLEISNGIRGLRLHREQSNTQTTKELPPPKITNTPIPGFLNTGSVGRISKLSGRLRAVLHARAQNSIKTAEDLWINDHFLVKFFCYFTFDERSILVSVCQKWRDVIYLQRFWVNILPIYNCRLWRNDEIARKLFYNSLETRGFDSICFFGASDADITDLINNYSACRKNIKSVIIRCSGISDSGLAALFKGMCCIYRLELCGCNDITEAGLWACLNPKIVSLSLTDCINVADDTVGAISQMLPSLNELNIQAYHVTDTALSFFSAKQSYTLSVLRLVSCWEITNHGLVNIVHSLPNLTILSLSGCSKISDDGVELIAENLRKLRILDLSWCSKVTDASLESIACDLTQLEELTLDRCTHITDIGIGYLSTMTTLTKLFLRWCTQIRDFALPHLTSMRQLQVLSLAGCILLTRHGLSGLTQLKLLEEIELTNCPSSSPELIEYLHENLPDCLVIG